MYFFKLFKDNPNLTVDEAISKTNLNYASKGWTTLSEGYKGKVFTYEGYPGYPDGIKFASKISFAGVTSGISDYIKVDDSYVWKQITLSNKTDPTWMDIRNLVDFMVQPYTSSQVYSIPSNLRNTSVYSR